MELWWSWHGLPPHLPLVTHCWLGWTLSLMLLKWRSTSVLAFHIIIPFLFFSSLYPKPFCLVIVKNPSTHLCSSPKVPRQGVRNRGNDGWKSAPCGCQEGVKKRQDNGQTKWLGWLTKKSLVVLVSFEVIIALTDL